MEKLITEKILCTNSVYEVKDNIHSLNLSKEEKEQALQAISQLVKAREKQMGEALVSNEDNEVLVHSLAHDLRFLKVAQEELEKK